MSLSGHQSTAMGSDTWLTPPEILSSLGGFDLDPCRPVGMPWQTAKNMVSLPQNGLDITWGGRVWLNPPFGRQAIDWLRKMKRHGNGIALIPARTETEMFFECVWDEADCVCFIKGRPHFHYADGTRAKFNSGAPICLVAYGGYNAMKLEQSGLGKVVAA